MTGQEFTALQITLLVRTEQGEGGPVKEFFNSTPFQYQMQDALGTLIKDQLNKGEVNFDEVIISIDFPADQAKPTDAKPSLMSRLLGKG